MVFISILAFITLALIWIFIRNKTILFYYQEFLRLENPNSVVIKNVRISYWDVSGLKYIVSPNCYCDLHLYSKGLVLFRRNKLIFNFHTYPEIITTDVFSYKRRFPNLKVFLLETIKVKKHKQGQVFIRITDPFNSVVKIEVTFRGLTLGQIYDLEKNTKWTNGTI